MTEPALTDRQLVALYGLYRGLTEQTGSRWRVYGADVTRALEALADQKVIARTGMGAYMIPWGGPGEAIINAGPDFVITEHL